MRIPKSARFALWCSRALGVLILILAVCLPALLDWYAALRPLGKYGIQSILIGFYCCVPVIALALWNLDTLLRNILRAQVFVTGNVRCISRVRWCCLAVCLICVPVACMYPPVLFVVLVMAFLSLVMSVLCSVMEAAVSIREENDLTI